MTLSAQGSREKKILSLCLKVHATSCCPCSKAISDYGAHNQRSLITLHAQSNLSETFPRLTDLIDTIEKSASCDLYPLIKREDEKYVTEKSYENAKFAEDIARDLVKNLTPFQTTLSNICVDVENFESIHNHSAFARCMLV
jgi:GTP cyclohydrolase I